MVHVHGPRRVTLAADEAGLVILARDAEWFLADCLAHHFDIGLRHVVVIDNGSTDRTAEIARGFANVTLLSCPLPAKRYEVMLRVQAAKSVFAGGWIAFADSDEMLELPAPLPRLLSYANGVGHTAILGQMLDMSPTILGQPSAAHTYAEARSDCNLYTLSGLEWVSYADPSFHIDWFLRGNRLSDPDIRMAAGGLRKLAFGEDPILTKHTIVRNRPGIEIMSHVHAASNVLVSDVTVAIRHYKFCGDWQSRDKTSVDEALWEHGEDRKRHAVASQSGFSFPVPSPKVWSGTDALLREGFLVASPQAKAALGLA